MNAIQQLLYGVYGLLAGAKRSIFKNVEQEVKKEPVRVIGTDYRCDECDAQVSEDSTTCSGCGVEFEDEDPLSVLLRCAQITPGTKGRYVNSADGYDFEIILPRVYWDKSDEADQN